MRLKILHWHGNCSQWQLHCNGSLLIKQEHYGPFHLMQPAAFWMRETCLLYSLAIVIAFEKSGLNRNGKQTTLRPHTAKLMFLIGETKDIPVYMLGKEWTTLFVLMMFLYDKSFLLKGLTYCLVISAAVMSMCVQRDLLHSGFTCSCNHYVVMCYSNPSRNKSVLWPSFL